MRRPVIANASLDPSVVGLVQTRIALIEKCVVTSKRTMSGENNSIGHKDESTNDLINALVGETTTTSETPPVQTQPKPSFVFREGAYEFPCPWCNATCEIAENQVNCGIFRCGVLKGSLQPIPPHEKKTVCDALRTQNKIWGCARPFKFDRKAVSKCDYV